MITIRKAKDRGQTKIGWLDSKHSFSFGWYHDPEHMGFGPLRVINDDRVIPGAGFDTHGHQDMEIISYVVEGAMAHEDSIGNGSVINAGDVQRMTAGRGITHSEYNASKTDPLRFLQIWIPPRKSGLQPGYEQKHFNDAQKRNQLRLLVSPEGEDESLTIHADARLYSTRLDSGEALEYKVNSARRSWVQIVSGQVTLNHQPLTEGDGAAVSEPATLTFKGIDNAEFLVFDLPKSARV